MTNLCRNLLLVCLLAALAGCSSSGRYSDIDNFMEEVESRPKGQIAPLPEFQPYQAFAYASSNRRSPFEPPVIIPPKNKEQMKNLGVKPPEGHVKEYLERYNITALSMVGTLGQAGKIWALIQDSDGGVHRVQVGDYLGTNYGRVDAIAPSRVDVIEIVSDGGEGWLERPRSLELNQSQ